MPPSFFCCVYKKLAVSDSHNALTSLNGEEECIQLLQLQELFENRWTELGG